MTLRCVIVDDSPAFVATARSLLEGQGMAVLAVVADGAGAVRTTRSPLSLTGSRSEGQADGPRPRHHAPHYR
jgi:CheY-like chemotaxis protein